MANKLFVGTMAALLIAAIVLSGGSAVVASIQFFHQGNIMTLHLPDWLVDAIQIEIAPLDAVSCVIVSFDESAPEETIAIKRYLESVSLFRAELCAQTAQEQKWCTGNDTGCMCYLHSEDGTPQGVEFIAHFMTEVIVSNEAADRLLTRFFDLMRQIAETENHEVLQNPRWRWQDFLVGAAAVKQRVLSRASTHN